MKSVPPNTPRAGTPANEIHTKADRMAGVIFGKTERSKRGMVRVQIRDQAGALKIRKWNYKTKGWGKWEPI